MQDKTKTQATHTLESSLFAPRETELAWTFHFPPDAVWDAVNNAITSTGLTPKMIQRDYGLAIAAPPMGLFSMGKRIAFAFFPRQAEGEGPATSTLVRATYTHGIVLLQGKQARMDMLSAVFRAALLQLDIPKAAPAAPQAQAAAPAPQGSAEQEPTASAPREPTEPAKPQTPHEASPGADAAAAGQTPPPSATQQPQADSHRNLETMNFGHLDWDKIPLERPSAENLAQYSRPAMAFGTRKTSFAMRMLWFLVGILIVLALALLSGTLDNLF